MYARHTSSFLEENGLILRDGMVLPVTSWLPVVLFELIVLFDIDSIFCLLQVIRGSYIKILSNLQMTSAYPIRLHVPLPWL